MTMEIIKKINNNVAVGRDANGNELVAFGNGIGFPKTPYTLTDLGEITMTFYQLDSHYFQLLNEIPPAIFDVSAEIVRVAQIQLNNNLNPNMIFSLADHIHFAITRMKKHRDMKLLFSYDIEQLYPRETELARYAIKLIQKTLLISLPDAEITNIAMHFVNAQLEHPISDHETKIDDLVESISSLIEDTFGIQLDRDEFSYNRFVMHVRYYLKRLQSKEQFMDSNNDLFISLKETIPEVYQCSLAIAERIRRALDIESTDDEIMYLMVHINRMVKKTKKESL